MGPCQAKTDKIDKDGKNMVPLTTYGRDEKYIRNKLWLNGVSSVILHGVGDGMVPWVCAQLRIPCLMIFDPPPSGEAHKACIEKHLKDKVKSKMLVATPSDTRWYRSNDQLQCKPEATEEKLNAKKPKKLAAADITDGTEEDYTKDDEGSSEEKKKKKHDKEAKKGKKKKKRSSSDHSDEGSGHKATKKLKQSATADDDE